MSDTPTEPSTAPGATEPSETAGLAALNALPAGPARQHLLACCSSARWADEMVSGRPYASADELLDRSDGAVAGLAQADVEQALAGHPRIGRPSGPAGGWSRREQAGVQAADRATAAALAEGNEAYERRFGHIYLVCASGRDGAELLALLRKRLGNDPATEWEVVRRELGQINRIRLRRLLEEGVSPATSAITTHVLDTARGVPAAGVPVRLDRVSAAGPGESSAGEGSASESRASESTEEIGRARTDADGRVRAIGPGRLPAGTYRLTFGTGDYFAALYAPSPPGRAPAGQPGAPPGRASAGQPGAPSPPGPASAGQPGAPSPPGAAPAGQPGAAFFPEVAVTFVIDGETPHYHVPLLLSPYGYSTYRGS